MTTTQDERQYPYGTRQRYHLQHVHLFSSDIEATIDFFKKWVDAEVMWDGDVAGARNVFIKIGIGALHLYDQLPRDEGKNAVHHLGMQVVGIHELYERTKAVVFIFQTPSGRWTAAAATSCSVPPMGSSSKSSNPESFASRRCASILASENETGDLPSEPGGGECRARSSVADYSTN